MGHVRGDVFRYYVNQIVDVDTQSIFLETPSRDALIKLSSNSSLTRDPSAPQDLDDKHKKSIESNPELLELTDRRNALRRDIIAKYQKICRSKGTSENNEYEDVKRKIHALRKKLEKSGFHQMYEEYFNNVGNTIIEANYQGNPVSFDPNLSTLPENRALGTAR